MSYLVEPIIINTEHFIAPKAENDLYVARKNIVHCRRGQENLTASIVILCYNRLLKSKRCIESVLKYTQDIDYELILIDNGSSDGTFEYLQSVPYENKKIIKITKNIGADMPFSQLLKIYRGKYLVTLANDIVVTANWLSNIIKCYESDDKIGFAVPMSTNVSNLQEFDIKFKNVNEIQDFAEKNNVSNPFRWKERMRVIDIINVFKREILDLVGTFDYGFFHDFSEDDFCIRVRRAGYKLILCEDSFVHHDHDFRNMEDKDPEEFQKSLNIGRNNYRDKYHGLDAWDDVNNYERNLIAMLSVDVRNKIIPRILGVDVRMGTPILEIRNKLCMQGIMESYSFGFCTQAKYFTDLQTICGQNVFCDRIDYIFEHFIPNSFDYIVLGEPINLYAQPVKLMQRLIEFAKPGGQILIKLKNVNNISKFVQILGGNKFIDDNMFLNIEPEELIECAKIIGITSYRLSPEMMNVEGDIEEALKGILKTANLSKDLVETTKKLEIENYLICLCK
ncbi:glycosyltransferase family 2 protein [Aminipila terrae]|uniref:Glycosyltransferase n=1 Tax=Aminipila terrae TaxID=2697030 RepID=A0A6P1MDG2_9FIRM|nr:glycosyltransferase [Aminipila terrae]QHI71947.1 glycosyltransferase [Aminipila terrae]